MPRPPSIQWYYKQWLGDNKVLAMDWDAKAMHFHLLNLSCQETPEGSIPNDMDAIRRWLSLPSGAAEWCHQKELGNSYLTGCRCPECLWRRVRPQIFAAWKIQDGRWFNTGMEETWQRKEVYRNRYETGTKNPRDLLVDEDSNALPTEVLKEKPLIPRRDKSGTRIPPGFKVSDEVRKFAHDNQLPDPDLHIAEFIDYWVAVPGQRGVKLDWDSTLRNWLRRVPGYAKGNGHDGHKTAALLRNERNSELIERVFREAEATENLPGHVRKGAHGG